LGAWPGDQAAAAILLVLGTSPGSALYPQRRVGKRGRRFDMLTLRSMVVDADQALDPC
jgi:lipopolysaccharide/colanic/teichoic acid biosynthesis glycosyltransferase